MEKQDSTAKIAKTSDVPKVAMDTSQTLSDVKVKRTTKDVLPEFFILFGGIFTFLALVFLATAIAIPSVDLKITQLLQSISNPFLTCAMVAISWIGFAPQSFILIGLDVIFLYSVQKRRESIVLLIASLFVQLLNLGIKILVHRPRPSMDLVYVVRLLSDYSFPSGHVMFYTVFFGFNGYLAYTLLPRSWKRTVLLTIFGGFVSLVGVSRVYLGAHWASDVVAAYLVSGIVLIAAIKIYQKIMQRQSMGSMRSMRIRDNPKGIIPKK